MQWSNTTNVRYGVAPPIAKGYLTCINIEFDIFRKGWDIVEYKSINLEHFT